jgi:hypothetical protein
MHAKLAGRAKTVGEIIVDQLKTARCCEMHDMGMGLGRRTQFQELCRGGKFGGRRAAGRMRLDAVPAGGLGGGDMGADDFLVLIVDPERNDGFSQCIESGKDLL